MSQHSAFAPDTRVVMENDETVYTVVKVDPGRRVDGDGNTLSDGVVHLEAPDGSTAEADPSLLKIAP